MSSLVKTHRLRVLIVAALSMAMFLAIEARLYVIQVRRHAYYAKLADSQHERSVTLNKQRGDILDASGEILATSTLYDTIYFNPVPLKKRGSDVPAELAPRLARLLDEPESRMRRILDQPQVATIARKKVPPEGSEAIRDAVKVLEKELRLPDGTIFFEKHSKRLYPQGHLAGPALGYTKIDGSGDNIGQEGLELEYNAELQGVDRKQVVQVNSWGGHLEPVDEKVILSTMGNSVVLTLNAQIQHLAQKALDRRVNEVQAEGGLAIVMEVKTGAILAMAVCPDFDPNDYSKALEIQKRDRALRGAIEIGSVMKIVTTTILLENRLLRIDEKIDCMGGHGTVDGRELKDAHQLGVVAFPVAFAESSNIAFAKLGLRIEPKLYYNSLRRFGLGQRTGIDLPGEDKGILHPLSEWTRLSRTSLPMGYESQMTGVQVASILASIGNGGVRMRPRIAQRIVAPDGRVVQEFPPTPVTRVASAETCKTVLQMMEGVVEEGTGKEAAVPGYSVGGKTGTTIKAPYHLKKYIASFAGLIPASDPALAIYVYVDDPDKTIEYYGGKVSAPVFAEIASHAARILGIPPDQPQSAPPTEAAAATPQPSPTPAAKKGEGKGDAKKKGEEAAKIAAVPTQKPTAKQAAMRRRDQALDNMPGEEVDALADSLGPEPPPAADGKRLPLNLAPKDSEWRKRVKSRMAAATVKKGIMPVCLGLTMPEVIELMARAEIALKFEGAGLAIRQDPPPGTKFEERQQGTVYFALPSQRVGDDAPADGAAPAPGT